MPCKHLGACIHEPLWLTIKAQQLLTINLNLFLFLFFCRGETYQALFVCTIWSLYI
jgi:hypothetical protein